MVNKEICSSCDLSFGLIQFFMHRNATKCLQRELPLKRGEKYKGFILGLQGSERVGVFYD